MLGLRFMFFVGLALSLPLQEIVLILILTSFSSLPNKLDLKIRYMNTYYIDIYLYYICIYESQRSSRI